MLVDEGIGYDKQMGKIFAVPGIAEKGSHLHDTLVSV